MSIKCGHCQGTHGSVAEVRECSGIRVKPGGEAERYLRNQQSLADGERDGRVWLDDVADGRATMEEYVAARDDLSEEQKAEGMRAYRRMAGVGEREATPKMVKYVRDILTLRAVPETVVDTVMPMLDGNRLSFNVAKRVIDTYRDAPRKPRPAQAPAQRSGGTEAPADLVDGMYRNPATGDIFKVYHTVHGANEQVAKRLHVLPEDERFTKTVRGKEVEVKAQFVYEGKRALAGLTPEMRMTLEEGVKYGAIYGVCVRCSATLTKEESIERAMGSTCAAKSNWA